jgi:RNA polymerase sigma factor (sigma-70 family)
MLPVARLFPSTPISALEQLHAADAETRSSAMSVLAEAYHAAVYKYARLKWSLSPEEADDATQGFFLHALERGTFAAFVSQRARFRTFVRSCFDRFVISEGRKRDALKRGRTLHLATTSWDELEQEHQATSALGISPEEHFERTWKQAFFSAVLEDLSRYCERKGKGAHFDLFRRYHVDPEACSKGHAELAAELGLSEIEVNNRLAYARNHFRRLALTRLRRITADEEDFREEARELLGVDVP